MITFTDFYQIYPRKVGRRAAELEWTKAMKRGEDPLAIMDGLKRKMMRGLLGIDVEIVK